MEEHDYMNDPRMEDLKDAPFPLRQVYSWRLAVQDKKEGMTPEQIRAYYETSQKETDARCAELGIKLNYMEPVATAL